MQNQNIAELRAQIVALQNKETELLNATKADAIQKIVDIMKEHELSFRDLEISIKGARKGITGVKGPKATVEAKYKGPKGDSWSGRGLTPRWLTMLIEAGHKKEEYLVEAAKK